MTKKENAGKKLDRLIKEGATLAQALNKCKIVPISANPPSIGLCRNGKSHVDLAKQLDGHLWTTVIDQDEFGIGIYIVYSHNLQAAVWDQYMKSGGYSNQWVKPCNIGIIDGDK